MSSSRVKPLSAHAPVAGAPPPPAPAPESGRAVDNKFSTHRNIQKLDAGNCEALIEHCATCSAWQDSSSLGFLSETSRIFHLFRHCSSQPEKLTFKIGSKQGESDNVDSPYSGCHIAWYHQVPWQHPGWKLTKLGLGIKISWKLRFWLFHLGISPVLHFDKGEARRLSSNPHIAHSPNSVECVFNVKPSMISINWWSI